ncbi:MAG TPA: fumarylacetoacetate hydrolase family protein [Burkholderiales bacterium]|nr:fumarylacetoacetate hydrolase family protein [Burkholderiales bacterium]
MRSRPKSGEQRIERAGAWLHEAHRARARFAPLPAALAPASVAEAYAIQSEFVGMRAAALGQVTGYKLALTTPAMRSMVGLTEPIAGDMHDKTIRRHGTPGAGTVRAADYVRLLVEFEIALEMADDLPAIGAPYDRAGVARAVGAVMPALELADDRDADYALLPANPLMLIADNAWNEGAVLGAPVRNWQGIDLAGLRGEASINGKSVGAGHGRDVMGHPLDALAWLANNLASRGLGLWRGDVVITGSLVTTKYPKPGDRIRFAAGGLGAVELQVE